MLFLHTVLAGPIAENDSSVDSMQFDGNCLGCVVRGYRYCDDYQACITLNGTCPRGISFTNKTSCPVSGECDFGFRGIGYIGDDTFPVGNGRIKI